MSILPTDLFLKLADLVSEHNQDFMSQMRSRMDQRFEMQKSLDQRSGELIEAARATLAQSPDKKGWSIVLRAARRPDRDTDRALALKHRLFEPGFVPADRAELIEAALDATLAVAATDLGNVQLIDDEGGLRIEAHKGFARPFLDFFAVVAQPESACGVAMSLGRQVFIPDVRRNSMFMGTAAGKVLDGAGCAAVTSSPLLLDNGLVVGMISTHYRKPCAEHQTPLASLELIAKRAASWLDAARPTDSRRKG